LGAAQRMEAQQKMKKLKEKGSGKFS
jgi:hypothetical protein